MRPSSCFFRWDYIDQRQNHLTQHQNWRESVNDVLGRNPDIDVDDNKYYYLKVRDQAFQTI